MKILKINLIIFFAISTIRCEGNAIEASQARFNMKNEIVPYSKKIPLTQGKFAIVSYHWYDFLMQWKWSVMKRRDKSGHYYAATNLPRNNRKVQKKVCMHRIVLCISDSVIICDHVDRNSLNNVPENLRIATYSQNAANRNNPNRKKNYIGVYAQRKNIKNRSLYMAAIRKGDKCFSKSFPYTPEGEVLAAKWRDEQAYKLSGEFAILNFKIK